MEFVHDTKKNLGEISKYTYTIHRTNIHSKVSPHMETKYLPLQIYTSVEDGEAIRLVTCVLILS